MILLVIINDFCFFFFQIVTDAPWELSDEFLDENKIDFVAHDEIPYTTDDTHDVYSHIKDRGMFVATERTEGNNNLAATICQLIRFCY